MSRYELDKVMRMAYLVDEHHAAFVADPVAFLAGRDLTEQERRALLERDVGAIYAMGGHPFLLFGWAMRLRDEPLVPFVNAYSESIERAIAAGGGEAIPDYST